MTEPTPRPEPGQTRSGQGWPLFGAWLFTVAAAAAVVLVAVDVFIGRPAAGDVFIAGLNAVSAVVLWRVVVKQAAA